MRTGRTLTVFQRTPPEKLKTRPTPQKKLETPPEKLETPPKNWRPPEKLEIPLGPDQSPPRKIGDPPGPDQTPPCGQTHACKNITLAKTSFRPVNISSVQAYAPELVRLEITARYK